MKKSTKAVIAIIVIILVVIYFTKSEDEPGKYDDFATCLTENDAIFYGSFQCPHCATQKEMFGNSIKKVNYVECGPLGQTPRVECVKAGVEVYPTWVIKGQTYKGSQQLHKLAELTECELPA